MVGNLASLRHDGASAEIETNAPLTALAVASTSSRSNRSESRIRSFAVREIGVGIPVIASGGVGTLDHLADGVIEGRADAVLAASIFHFGDYTVREAKACLTARGIEVRHDVTN